MLADDVVEVELVEVGKGKVISYLYDKGYAIEVEELNILIYFLHFLCLRLYATVGIYHAVDAEVSVGRSAVFTIVAAVCPVFASVGGLGGKSLVYPVPDATALQDRIFFDEIPVFLEVSETVSHGMGIFAEDERTGHFGVLGIFLDLGGAVVHGTEDVRIPLQLGALVLYGTAVQRLQCVVCDVEVHSVAGFVAQ